jgi:hypothetical protein
MSYNRFIAVGGCLLLLLVAGCSSSRKQVAETPPTAATQVQEPQAAANLAQPADPKSAAEAVHRVFKDSVTINTAIQPAFIVGDFNGDESADIAIAVKPVPEKLAELNEEYPTWILRDPFGPVQSAPRLRVTANDALLAVIHGYGPSGWRDSQATQTYLLKNAVGSSMATRSRKDLQKDYASKKMPQLRGDVISEAIQGQPGYLYFASATYGWYDPNTFQEPEMRRGHGGMRQN